MCLGAQDDEDEEDDDEDEEHGHKALKMAEVGSPVPL